LVCHDPKFVFYAPNKTGTGSIWQICRGLGWDVDQARKHFIEVIPGVTSSPDYFHFITVRNPFDRAVSMWRYYKTKHVSTWPSEDRRTLYEAVKDLSFEQFLLDLDWDRWRLAPVTSEDRWREPFNAQHLWYDAMPRCDMVIRMENYVAGVRQLPFIPNDQAVPRRNRTSTAPWQDNYRGSNAEQLAQAVLNAFGKDFDTLGYSPRLTDYMGDDDAAEA
jgi:hypothetical protein